jgi:hypothetical protein
MMGVYALMLRGLREQSGVMVMSAIPHERLIGFSDEAIQWLNRNGHALVMWGAARVTAQRIRNTLALAFLAILLTSYRSSWSWLWELLIIAGVAILLHDGFVPLNRDKLVENSASGKDAFLVEEIMPLAGELIEADMKKYG